MAGQVFFQSVAKQATPGSFGFASQALGPFEDVFRNRDSSFHTRSITALLTQWQAGGTPAEAVTEARRLGFPFHKDEGKTPLSASMMAKDKIRPAAIKVGLQLETWAEIRISQLPLQPRDLPYPQAQRRKDNSRTASSR